MVSNGNLKRLNLKAKNLLLLLKLFTSTILGRKYSFNGMCRFEHDLLLVFQLEVARKLELGKEVVAPIYISIAVTFCDCKKFEDALEYYKMELQLRDSELKEVCHYCHIQ